MAQGDGGGSTPATSAGGKQPPSERGLLPTLSLPKGGGAIRGIGEKLSTNPATGTSSLSIPIATSSGRAGFELGLQLGYDSGAGNGPFGLGWRLSAPSITRKTDKGLPRYLDEDAADVFVLSAAEDLVPIRLPDDGGPHLDIIDRGDYRVQRYRPRVEGLFARIERWTNPATADVHWRVTSRDNVLSIYGRSADARIADPEHPDRVFSWLLEETRDDRGHVVCYRYKAEDGAGVDPGKASESSRFLEQRDGSLRFAATTQRYLKRIRYSNRAPVRRDEPAPAGDADWLFEVVFDYGDHDSTTPTPLETRPWTVRSDPFSSYRPTFEVRSYRLCQRVLMFHRFAELGATPCLVRSTDFAYEEGRVRSSDGTYDQGPATTYLAAVTHAGYLRDAAGTYQRATLPPIDLGYTQPIVHDRVQTLDRDSLAGIPTGVGTSAQWVDLDGEGIPGVLIPTERAWYYKTNLGEGRLGPPSLEASLPSPADLRSGIQQLTDLGGDGNLDLVRYAPPLAGYFERTSDHDWAPFVALREVPNLDWNDPNLRFLDLDGDGFPDVLITQHDAFVWYRSKAKGGFEAARTVRHGADERKGPAVVFSDGVETIHVADMSGSGLADLVRVRNGEVCYWPNLGYGRFGRKVTLDRSPRFDSPDQFDPRRIRFADIDGSGTNDVVYLGRQGVHVYFNQSGNALSAPLQLRSLPPVDTVSSLSVVDLLGQGMACLVWSSFAPGYATRPLAYVDLMGGRKPHLLESVVNNLGAETRIGYAPSTKFYLRDKAEGRPWVTRLAFPVHVIERVETYDAISQNRFVTRYAYHHGHYDGVEREFRGFAQVDQWDTEEFAALQADGLLPPGSNDSDPASHVPPVWTRTWFHTGGHHEGAAISRHLAGEYWRKTGHGEADFEALLLDDTVLPEGLSSGEQREACRALTGSILRQEVYGEDGSDRAGVPYTVSEHNYAVEVLQRRGGNKHAVFLVHPRESINYHYERDPDDPRTGHEVVLEVDDFGNVRRAAAVSYGRRPECALPGTDGQKQTRLLCALIENEYTNFVDQPDDYRARMPAEVSTFELTGLAPMRGARLTFAQIDQAARGAAPIVYEATPTGCLQKRLIERVRTLYRHNDLSGPLPRGQIESLGLPHESYNLALTPGLVQRAYGERASDAMLSGDGRYVHVDGDSAWWVPTGQVFYSPGEADDPATELAQAKRHFFLPRRARDPFGQSSTMAYDRYDLLPREARDPLGNLVTAESDYRVLGPCRMLDPNRNRTAVRFDGLGLVVASAVMGKEGAGEGDTLDDPTTRLEYDLLAWKDRRQPPFVHSFNREQHGPQNPRWQEAYSYSDGFGREIQTKSQAEPGPLVDGGPPVSQRWTGSGWTIFNNKGKPVRQYEPFFTATSDFELARVAGVSSILFYDPAGRVVGTLHPNHSYEKVVFDPWQQSSWDVNDTVSQEDPTYDPHLGGYFARLVASEYRPTWHEAREGGAMGAKEQAAAAKAAVHAATPSVVHLDSMGRAFLTVANNGADGKYVTRVELDIEGNQREVHDARGRAIVRYDHDMLGTRIHEASMEAGERWMLNDIAGKTIYGWDSRDHILRTSYDALRRPTELHLREGGAAELLVDQMIYGESQPDPEARNLRGQLYRSYDCAGVVTNEEYDFKGNLLSSTRQLAVEYKKALDWSADVPMEEQSYRITTSYDALSRPATMTTPDQSVLRPAYNEANLLQRIDGNLRGAAEVTVFVGNLDYNAKGQRELIEYGNGVRTSYTYDPLTFRLSQVVTTRGPDRLQDMQYTYDAVGNITHIRDEAQQTIYFRNRRVEPSSDYTYDAIYRLIEATGREHLGQVNGGMAPPTIPGHTDAPRVGLLHPGDGNAMGRYVEKYVYDEVGNFLSMSHRGTGPASPGWTRTYAYDAPSPLEPDQRSNRLSRTTVGDITEVYRHDVHGNMTSMPHLSTMRWDYRDRLQATAQQAVNAGTAETTCYVYDAAGRRIRKVTDRASGARKAERVYLGPFEMYREYGGDGTTVALERETLHVRDGNERVALIETRTRGNDPSTIQLLRYQFANHVGSAMLELDELGRILSYEEYLPHGSTAYSGSRDQGQTPKRYRYTGMERDEESGLSYHGTRYYACWLGRWTSTDSAGLVDGPNLYRYARANPVRFNDPSGQQPPDAANFATLDSFMAASPGPYSPEYLQSVWEATHGPMTPSVARNITYSAARAEANSGARAYRAMEGMAGPQVQAGHTVAARHTPMSGISRAAANAPETFMQLQSWHGQGMSVMVDGHPNPLTPHNAQELIIDDAVERVCRANGGTLTPAGHQASGAEVRWRLQGTGFDQREADLKRASGLFDEAAAIEASQARRAVQAELSTSTSVQQAAQTAEATAGSGALLRGAGQEVSLLGRVGKQITLFRALFVLNLYFAWDSYRYGTSANTPAPMGNGMIGGSEGEGILNAVGTLAGGLPAGTMMRQAGEFGSAVHDPGRVWDAVRSGSSPTSVGMGIAFGAFR